MEPHWSNNDYFQPYCAGIPGELRLIYAPPPYAGRLRVTSLEPEVNYRAFLFDPATGQEIPLGKVRGSANGMWQTPILPKFQDWLWVLHRQ